MYEIHRRSVHPAMRVCKEWGSLLLNEDVKVVCEDQRATDWIGEFFSSANFMAQAQAIVVRAFGLGTGAWALWVDLDRNKVRIRHYDARYPKNKKIQAFQGAGFPTTCYAQQKLGY